MSAYSDLHNAYMVASFACILRLKPRHIKRPAYLNLKLQLEHPEFFQPTQSDSHQRLVAIQKKLSTEIKRWQRRMAPPTRLPSIRDLLDLSNLVPSQGPHR